MTTAGLAAEPPRYAGVARRGVAILLDLALGWAAYSVAITLLDPHVASEYATTGETVLGAVIVLATAILWLAYFVCAQWRFGQTLGMRAVGIRVVAVGDGLRWSRALVRSLALAVDLPAGCLLIARSARRQRLGDRLANTVVVMNRTEPTGAPGAPGAVQRPDAAPGAGGAAPPPPGGDPGPRSGTVAASRGPGRVVVGVVVLLIASLIEVAVVSIFDPGLDSLGGRLVAQALLAVTLIGIAYWVAAESGSRGGLPATSLGLRQPLRSPYGFAAAAFIAYLVFAIAYGSLVHPHQRDITRDLGFGHGDLGSVAAGFLIILAAPVSEEIFFRGFIFGGFRRNLSFPVAAVLSALIFGLFHYTGSGSEAVIPQLAFLGLAFAWVYEETGSIYPTIALHILNNAFAFALLAS